LAKLSLEQGDPLGWFEVLYQENGTEGTVIPWADHVPNPHLVEWARKNPGTLVGKKALKIGCGLGDDAEYLEQLGCLVTAFDIAPTAIAECRKRFPDSSVRYEVQDLFQSPSAWTAGFDFVLESYTLQVFPPDLRRQAIPILSGYLAPSGTLLVVCRGREENQEPGGMPWPLTRPELNAFLQTGLQEIAFEDYIDHENPPVRRFRVQYEKEKA
jgi:SAM-dependent methyltransferase